MILRKTDCRLGSGSTAIAIWHRLTVEEVEAGLVATDVSIVRRWWLEEN